MTFYHASNHKDLTEILPLSFPKSGDEKVCYFTPSRNYALFYLRDLEINAVTGGVKDDGIIDYDEFCPNQLEILYKGRSGYIYSVENNSEITLGHTSGIWTATQPVPITAVEYIDDVYAEILKLIESGECKITRYEDWTDGEKQTHTAQMRSYIIKNKFFTDKPNRTHYFYSNFFERKDYKPMSYKINTKCIQSGYAPKNGEPRVLPIYQSTTYKYESSEQMGNLFDLKEEGYFYSRLQNPTNDAVAAKISDLEGGVAAILTSSGQAATFYSVFNICGAGDHVVCSTAIYGGTFNLFNVTMRKLGVDFTFVDPDSPEEELLK
ncbi:MAG: PLP-dependent transferase, partial [Oscillospiraceae bacterium]|nr:PLP-dependent transferase [Oscillospiraceae bacterium]